MKASLIYRASKDGFNSKAFHNLCDGVEKTIVILRSDLNEIFGGYADGPWNQSGSWIAG